jgi:hypothetical protein
MLRFLCFPLALTLFLLTACEPKQAETANSPANTDEEPAEQKAKPAQAPQRDGDSVAGYHGFGPANFGDNEESVRMAWGMPLMLSGQEGDSCRQLFMDPPLPAGFGISFMLEEGRFVRYDVGNQRFTAPGGGAVGDSAEKIGSIYGIQLRRMPHKYVEGAEYLVIGEEKAGPVLLIFETDARGMVTRWRIGVPPAVHFVEGCG